MEYILFGYIWTILFHMSRNEMVLQFEVALNIEKQSLTKSLHENRNDFPNNLILYSDPCQDVTVKVNAPVAGQVPVAGQSPLF